MLAGLPLHHFINSLGYNESTTFGGAKRECDSMIEDIGQTNPKLCHQNSPTSAKSRNSVSEFSTDAPRHAPQIIWLHFAEGFPCGLALLGAQNTHGLKPFDIQSGFCCVVQLLSFPVHEHRLDARNNTVNVSSFGTWQVSVSTVAPATTLHKVSLINQSSPKAN